MSAITDEQRQALIIAQVGEEGTILADNIDVLWDMYEYFSDTDPMLRDLVVKRECIKLVLGKLRNSVNILIVGDSSVASHQRIETLLEMLKETKDEIKGFSNSSAVASISVGLLTTVAPESPPYSPSPDANHKSYSGNPYYRGRQP